MLTCYSTTYFPQRLRYLPPYLAKKVAAVLVPRVQSLFLLPSLLRTSDVPMDRLVEMGEESPIYRHRLVLSRRDEFTREVRRVAIRDTSQPSHALIHRLSHLINHRVAIQFALVSIASRFTPPVEILFLPLYTFLGFSWPF